MIDVANRKPFGVRCAIRIDPGEGKNAFNASTFCQSVQQFNVRFDRGVVGHGDGCRAVLTGFCLRIRDRSPAARHVGMRPRGRP